MVLAVVSWSKPTEPVNLSLLNAIRAFYVKTTYELLPFREFSTPQPESTTLGFATLHLRPYFKLFSIKSNNVFEFAYH